MLKPAVLDPQGRAVLGGLHSLGYGDVEDVRVGKEIVLTLRDMSEDEAEGKVREMCQRLLSNPVIEDFKYALEKES
jgi:phosphoribosylformylglycinamidine synthase